MRADFVFKEPKGKFLTIRELTERMDIIIAKTVSDDFERWDNYLIEIFDRRGTHEKNNPPLRSLGKMPIKDVLAKFN